MSRSTLRTALAVVAAIFAALIVVQVFLAGLGVFDDPRAFLTHRDFGYTIGMLTLVILILSILARAGRRLIGLAVLGLVQMALQSVFIAVRADLPQVAALHPVNGVLLLVVTLVIARGAWAIRRAPAGAVASAGVPERSLA
jgi:mercuric ion transport protein